jgi:beta-RFAP synthase
LHGLALRPREDADVLGRGTRSGVGVSLFEHGGLVLDGGRGSMPPPPPLLSRLPIPDSWRVLLLLDPAHNGLSGPDESAAFGALPPMSETVSGELCRVAVMQILPAAAETDLARFGAGLTRMQEIVGDHFAPTQGGRVASPRVAAALARLRELGLTGLGQSSWGPTGFAFAEGEATARRAAAALVADTAGVGLDILVCRGLNRGAIVRAA